jgi:hypothetical protein
MLVIGTFYGHPLDTRLPDNSILVGYGRPMERPPEFAIGPEGKYLLPILKVKQPARLLPGDPNLVVTPETEVPAKVLVETVCPHCSPDTKKVMKGYLVVTPPIPGFPNMVIQCANCYRYLWVDSPAMRKYALENGTNLTVEIAELRQ